MEKRFVLFFTLAWSVSIKADADRAMKFYLQEDYQSAIQNWNKELKNPSANLGLVYANLGNCLFKLKDYSHAILFYEKSLKENSNDAQVLTNIQICKARLGLSSRNRELFIYSYIKKLSYALSIAWYQFIVVILAWTLLILAILKRWKFDAKMNKPIVLTITLLALFFVGFFIRKYYMNSCVSAIVVNPTIGYQDPSMNTGNHQVRMGEKVEVIEQIGKVSQVKLEVDSIVWIKNADILKI